MSTVHHATAATGMTGTTASKAAVVLDDRLPIGLAANAAAVLTMTLGARHPELVGRDLTDADGVPHPGITVLPLPVLAAPAERLRRIRGEAALAVRQGEDVLVVDFTDIAQRTHRYDDYAEALAGARADDLAYAGVLLCGPRTLVDHLTGSLPLLR